jgi:hypothetical protein
MSIEEFCMTIRENIKHIGRTANLDRGLSGYLQLSSSKSTSRETDRSDLLNEVKQRLVGCLTHIIRTFDCRESPDYFPLALSLLESMPLSTTEFDMARHRLDNAQRYADSFEPGAAVYELRILLGRFRR